MGDLPLNPAAKMIRRIAKEMQRRIEYGEVRYQRDKATLLKHLALARELEDVGLMAWLKMLLGMIEDSVGNFHQAAARWIDAYATYHSHGDKSGMASAKVHLGQLYFYLNRLEDALEALTIARALAEEAGDLIGIMQVEGSLGSLWLAKGEMLKARVCFSLVIAVTEDEPWEHVGSIIEAQRGLAEVFLANGNTNQAWHKANEAEELARGRKLLLPLGHILFTKAHIAAQDENVPGNVQDYLQSGIETLKSYGNPIKLARSLMIEARYQKRHHNRALTLDFALQARDIYVQLELTAEIDLVEEFLLELG